MTKAGRPLMAVILFYFAATSFAFSQAAAHGAAKTGASPMNGVIDTLFAVKNFWQAAVAPDGKHLAWVEATAEGSAIYVAPISGGSPSHITVHGKSEGGVAWSRDSRQLAFLSDAEDPGQQQLYVTNATGSSSKKLTNVKGFLATPSFSPDGKIIAILFTENAERAAGPLVAEKAQTGVIKEAVTEQRLALVEVASGKLSQISPADMYVYEYDWSPDGQTYAVAAFRTGSQHRACCLESF